MPALELYEPDKGTYSRWILGLSATALTALGVYSLYFAVPEAMRQPIFGWEPLGDQFPISWALIASVVGFLIGAGATWWAINYPRLVDFFQETEIEMGKVSWATRSEVVSGAIVVIILTILVGIWVYAADLLFAAVLFEGIPTLLGR